MRHLGVLWRRAPRTVVSLQSDNDVRIEGEDHFVDAQTEERLAIVAHWSSNGRVSRSTSTLLNQLGECGFKILMVSTAETIGSLEWSHRPSSDVTVLRRPNVGYDFGSWATALNRYPRVAFARRLLLMNDSLMGPFISMAPLLRSLDATAAQVWGMTDTTQFAHHLQSYCLAFCDGSLLFPPIARFWRDIRPQSSRDHVIYRYEIELGKVFRRNKLRVEAAIPYARVVRRSENPTIMGWRGLLDEGFPFVKRQLFLEPDLAPDGYLIRTEIRDRFGAEADDWI